METEKPVDIEAACKALEEAPGVKLVDDIANLKYPMPLTATGAYDVEVGRLRKFLILRLWLGVLCIRRSAFEVMYVGGGSHVSLLSSECFVTFSFHSYGTSIPKSYATTIYHSYHILSSLQ